MITIRLPESLAKYCGGQRDQEVEVGTVAAAIDELVSSFPDVGSRVLDESGRLRVHLMVLCNDRAVRPDDFETRGLVDGDELSLLFLAGGG
ncbi:MAG TPA: hypothetical protein DER64_02430 [Planctomycetaceae bacterium]|nr:hypothetical protein [Planctomycetaceae bacterium]